MSYDVLTPGEARLFDYAPDWGGSFSVRRAFRTDITTSRNNTEQRRSIRDAPRLSVEYRTVVQDADLRAANHFLRAWQNKPVVIPDFARWVRTTGSSAGGASTLTIASPPAWVAADQRLVICGPETEAVLVDGVAGSTVTLVDTLDNAVANGAVVRPTFHGLFEGKLSSSRFHHGAAEISVAINAYPGGEPPRAAGAAWASFNSREVFTALPDFRAQPTLSYLWPIEEVDYGRGRTAQIRPIERQEIGLECEFNGCDQALAGEVEQFFDRMKGRRTAFYLPSGEKDFTLQATAASGTSFFIASGSDLAADFGSIDYATWETAVAVFLTDGTAYYRLVTDISASGGNSRVDVSAAWPQDITAANVARICWLALVRFATDEMVTRWRTPLAADIRLPFQSVRA
jgi:hypothetical protein